MRRSNPKLIIGCTLSRHRDHEMDWRFKHVLTRNSVQSEVLFLDLAVFWKRLTRTSNFPAANMCFQCSILYIRASIVCFILDFPDRKSHLIWPYLMSKSGSIVNNLKSFQAFARWWFQLIYFHPYLGKWSNLINMFQMGWNQLVCFPHDFTIWL